MVKIGDIYLGGADGSSDQRIFNSGIGFFLATDSKISNTLLFENKKWEVELKEGQQSIIARCTDVLPEDRILESGLKYCQQTLDLLSIEYGEYFSIQELGNFHTFLHNKGGEFILKQVQTTTVIYDTHVDLVHYDINGNIVPEPAPPEPKYTVALLFYRLAQNTNDLYEAYRNAYLCFESLLNDIDPIPLKKNGKPAKGERDWFKDALNVVNSKIQLIDFVPQGTIYPIEYFVKSQYDEIRCKLFHAKGDKCLSNIIIPINSLDPIAVSEAYEKLMLLSREILIKEYHIKAKRGVITNLGFKSEMENNLSNGYLLFINADNSPINGNLKEIHNFPLIEEQLENKKQLWANIDNLILPNKIEGDLLLNLQHNTNGSNFVKISGELNKNRLNKIHPIYRTSLIYIDEKFRFVGLTVFYNKDGLYLSGIDKFESNINIKLKNKGYPQK
jgi:hypothetical protein